jgi:hypothetical protein
MWTLGKIWIVPGDGSKFYFEAKYGKETCIFFAEQCNGHGHGGKPHWHFHKAIPALVSRLQPLMRETTSETLKKVSSHFLSSRNEKNPP